MHPRSAQAAMRFGARVELAGRGAARARSLGDRREKHVIVSARPRRDRATSPTGRLGHRARGRVDARRGRAADRARPSATRIRSARRRIAASAARASAIRAIARWQDRAVFSQVMCWIDWSRFSGDHVARPHERRRRRAGDDPVKRAPRSRSSRVYWALLAFGMALYTSVRSDALDVLAPVWVGAIAGTRRSARCSRCAARRGLARDRRS